MGARGKTEPDAKEHIAVPGYIVLIDGKPHVVELLKEGDNTYKVKINNQQVKAVWRNDRSDPRKPFTTSVDGKTYKIELDKIEWNKDFKVKVDEGLFKAELRGQTLGKPSSTAFEPVEAVGVKRAAVNRVQRAVQGAVTAPMTGKVVAVRVKKGEQVKEKQVLCVIEAMKMENEIAAPKAGRVEEVNVSEGVAVSEGEVLLIVI